MTPPAIAPAFDLLRTLVAEGGPVEDAPAEDVYTPEAAKTAPGPYSGSSPASRALSAFHLFSFVTSRIAQFGTRIPGGTGFGNCEGGKVDVQLDTYLDQLRSRIYKPPGKLEANTM